MKKFVVALLALVVAFSLSAVAQYDSGMDKKDSKDSASVKAKDMVGTISQDGTSFTTDKGNKTFKLQNPDAVKGHEGHHVKLNAHYYPDKGEAHVMSVSMNTGKESKDASK
jgi:hypothetical protein